MSTAPLIPGLRRTRVPRQSPVDTLVSSLAAGVDRSLMRAVSLVVEKRLLPRDVDLDALRGSVLEMLDTNLVARPDAFFHFVPAVESAARPRQVAALSAPRRGSAGAHVYRREMSSGYQPHPEVAPRARPGDRILFEHWLHGEDETRATVIILHGFAMGWPAVDGRILSARHWFEKGLNVVLLTLPDHGPRRSPGAVLSGQRFTVPHALELAGAVHQAIYEIFELKTWLRSRGASSVGLFGMSLGGYLTSICAGLSGDFDFLVPLVPPACMGDLAWRVYRDTGHHRSGYEPVLTEMNMRAAFFIHSPLAHERRVAREKILIAAGAGDRIVPPEHPSALWEHWDRPAIHWFRGSHVAPVVGRGLMRAVSAHLQRLDIL